MKRIAIALFHASDHMLSHNYFSRLSKFVMKDPCVTVQKIS